MDLLYEALHLKHTLDEIKKEAANSARMTPEQQKERKEEESAFSQDYAQYVHLTHSDHISAKLTGST